MATATSSSQLWSVMHRAAQQIIDELRARGRKLDAVSIGSRVARLLDDVPGVREQAPILVAELRQRLRPVRKTQQPSRSARQRA